MEVRGPVTGRVRLERIEDVKEPTLTGFVHHNVGELWLDKHDELVQTRVETDAWQGYNGLTRKGYSHRVINLNAAPSPVGAGKAIGVHGGDLVLWMSPPRRSRHRTLAGLLRAPGIALGCAGGR